MKAVRTMHGTVSLNKALLAGPPLKENDPQQRVFGPAWEDQAMTKKR